MKVRNSVISHFPPPKLRIPHAQYILLSCARVQVQWCWLGAGTSVRRSFCGETGWPWHYRTTGTVPRRCAIGGEATCPSVRVIPHYRYSTVALCYRCGRNLPIGTSHPALTVRHRGAVLQAEQKPAHRYPSCRTTGTAPRRCAISRAATCPSPHLAVTRAALHAASSNLSSPAFWLPPPPAPLHRS